MASLGSIFAREEAKIKRDDDIRPHDAGRNNVSRKLWSTPIRFRRRRIVSSAVAVLLLYIFIRNIPTDIPPASTRLRPNMSPGAQPIPHAPQQPVSESLPPRDEENMGRETKHYFNGPIKFYKLAASLHGIAKTGGHRPNNRNVLFAAANLQSASALIPMACEMARWSRNYVHFVVMGRDDVTIEDILQLNGAGAECDVYWHDGRPDYSPYSSDYRMRASVLAGLKYVDDFMHPQVLITDNSGQEDMFFTTAVREKTTTLHKALIELPRDAAENLMWLTRLDSGSLRAWSSTNIEILIHASPGASGSLIRLLRSIERADYFGSKRPRLTIELPQEVDLPTKQYLETLVWPPIQPESLGTINEVVVRHRIDHKRLSVEEASTRFLESFYPVTPSKSHVLVLSQQAELSPLYFHYLKYTLLEYKYSSYGSPDSKHMVGISLIMPTTHLNDSEPFSVPAPKSRSGPDGTLGEGESLNFLWQAPNSDAALYFGEKWVEFHDFLGNRLETLRSHMTIDLQSSVRKSVAETHPSWMEYLLELIRARGYFMLFPGFDTPDALATVHKELYMPPEEFVKLSVEEESRIGDNHSSNPLTADPAQFAPPSRPVEPSLISQPLLSILPLEGDLPEVPNMPHLSYDGRRISSSETDMESTAYRESFRRTIGACSKGNTRDVKAMSTADLFCLHDEEDIDGGESRGTLVNSTDTIFVPAPLSRNATSSSAGSSLPAATNIPPELDFSATLLQRLRL
ncbi:MAG: hypothetical protein M1812_001869 [Candelaria pacifica]|nr:MAG: hypothetical protein M1812_001869 [Candelaria pacifica]